MQRPSIAVVMIQRNERRDAPKALKSCESFADHFVVVDTGSTDDSQQQISAAVSTSLTYEVYTDASEQIGKEWRIVNFAKARNRAVELGEQTGCSWIFWLDADDLVETPLAVRRAAYMSEACYGMFVELGGGMRQVSYRMWPAKWNIRFHGWCHEWQEIGNHPQPILQDVCIRHDATPHDGAGENSNQRNLRILTAQYAAEPDSRTAFYLANTHKDAGRWKEATEWYRKRLEYGAAWKDEYLFAMLYLSRCYRHAKDIQNAAFYAEKGWLESDDWQEFRMELAFIYYDQKNYEEAIIQAKMALDKPVPKTVLWREPQMYKDQPARLISWAYEHMGNIVQAFVWSHVANRRIGQYDAEWERRQLVLEQRMLHPPEAPAIVKGLRRKIALHRPGAIGDILMTLNLIPAFKEANPDTDVHYFCHANYAKPEALGSIMIQAGVDMVMDAATLPQWEKQYERVINLVGYPVNDGYPEKPMRLHLLHYFAIELGLAHTNIDDEIVMKKGPSKHLPALTLRKPELTESSNQYITVQPNAGWSKYKQWDADRWKQVRRAMAGVRFMTIDASAGRTLAQSIALFANARMHIGIDSFCNHLTNYFWTDEHGNGRRVPGVILWGSTQASAAGYPHNTNISLGLPCQPCFRENPDISRMSRGPCINPPRSSYNGEDGDTPWACMDGISVDMVVDAVRKMWEETA